MPAEKLDIFDYITSEDSHYNKINSILNLNDVPNSIKVEFALFCTKDCSKYIDGAKYPDLKEKVNKCLKLVADYLLRKDISKKELNAAANAANAAAMEKYYKHLLFLVFNEFKINENIIKYLYL